MTRLKELLEDNPIIPSVKTEAQISAAIEAESEIVFILYGDIISLPRIVKKFKDVGKTVLIDIDLIDGLAGKRIAVEYVKKISGADGVMTNKANLIVEAKKLNLMTIHRYFVIDSKSLLALKNQYQISKADAVEIMPGLMPGVIRDIAAAGPTPIIASGLVCDKKDILSALDSGAISTSMTNEMCWGI